jgi:hypothetical protein
LKLFFRDNFFSSGETEVVNEQGEHAGVIDLRSAFSSSLDVYGPDRQAIYCGKFKFLSGKWYVLRGDGTECGTLRARFALFQKRFEYTNSSGVYEITSPAFAREYEIIDSTGSTVASFQRTNGMFQSGAFVLDNFAERFDSYELIAVIMGIYQIQKAASNAAT